ncbi:MAG: Rpp14/Pop5 family protein [archaeon]
MPEKFPSREECIAWLKELKMPENILAHVMQVNRIAVFIAKKLKQKGVAVDVDLVDRASILHDIDKHLTIETGRHGFVGKELLEKKGYPKLAEFCVTHLLTFVLEHEFPSLEHKIVFYADKRANGDKIVSLNERFDYFAKRYGSKSPQALVRIMKAKPFCIELEQELLSPIGGSPELAGLSKPQTAKKQALAAAKKQPVSLKVKASKRPKKRYLLFEVKSLQTLESDFVKRFLVFSLRDFFGAKFEQKRIWVVLFDQKKSMGIIRCSHLAANEISVFLGALNSLGGKKVSLLAILSSGSIKKLKQKIKSL